MNNIGDILKNRKLIQNGSKDKRAFLISEFVDQINLERVNTKYKKVTGTQIAVKLSHLNFDELLHFMSSCKDYKNRKGSFSKYFFGTLKI
jgi:hypothetical protein